jgi:PBP1b-binding outer membrane lipoprotein LpoB
MRKVTILFTAIIVIVFLNGCQKTDYTELNLKPELKVNTEHVIAKDKSIKLDIDISTPYYVKESVNSLIVKQFKGSDEINSKTTAINSKWYKGTVELEATNEAHKYDISIKMIDTKLDTTTLKLAIETK